MNCDLDSRNHQCNGMDKISSKTTPSLHSHAIDYKPGRGGGGGGGALFKRGLYFFTGF